VYPVIPGDPPTPFLTDGPIFPPSRATDPCGYTQVMVAELPPWPFDEDPFFQLVMVESTNTTYQIGVGSMIFTVGI
jgi:hypothetical protein